VLFGGEGGKEGDPIADARELKQQGDVHPNRQGARGGRQKKGKAKRGGQPTEVLEIIDAALIAKKKRMPSAMGSYWRGNPTSGGYPERRPKKSYAKEQSFPPGECSVLGRKGIGVAGF